MTRWRIRDAQLGDADALCALEASAFGPASWGADAVAEGLTAPYVSAIVASKSPQEDPCGFVFWRLLADEAEILTLGVAPESRREGCGGAILRAVINAARSQRATRLFLEVDATNEAAAALYRRHGFEEIGRRVKYYRDGGDALVMRLNL